MDIAEYQKILGQARSYSSAREWSEAAPLWERVVEANPYNGRGWDQLAEALLELGEFATALEAFRQVERYGVYAGDRLVTFPGATWCMIAACHAGLGELDAAFDALESAMAAGFTHVDEVLDDARLGPLRDHPRFAEVLGLVSVDGLSRDEGWRADVRLVEREAYRRRPVHFEAEAAAAFDREGARLRDDIPGLTDAEIAVRLTKLLVLLGDGHAFLAPDANEELDRTLPVQFYWFEEGVFVTSAREPYQSLLGQEVLAFDATPIDDVLRAVDPLISRDHELRHLAIAPGWLRRTPFLHALGLVRDPGKVTLRTHDGEVEVAAEVDSSQAGFPMAGSMAHLHDRQGELPLYLRNVASAYWYEEIPERRLGYVQFNRVTEDEAESLAAFGDRVAERVESGAVDRIVVDLRWNGGGNTFLVAPMLRRIGGCRSLDRPGGLFLIVGRGTFSAAGNTAKLLEWLGGANLTVVGEPTGSNLRFIGETVPFGLPYSGLRCNISNLYWQGITPLDRRTWIPPDLYTPPTFAAYSGNRDPAMDAILASIDG